MPEVAGQRIVGREMSEKECYLVAIKGLREAAAGLRGVAAHRGDGRWLLPVRLLDQITDHVTRLKDKGGLKPMLWLPPDRDRRL